MNKKLVAYRKLIGLTQAQMAELINISPTSYCHKENGKKEFTQKEMVGITAIIKEKVPDITMDEIFFNDDISNLLSRVS